MSIGIRSLMDALSSLVAATGRFDRVTGHEPRSAPGLGITAAVFPSGGQPVPASGLDSTSVRVVLTTRLYHPAMELPDEIDPNMIDAADDVMASLAGDVDLGSRVRMVDIKGAHGTPMTWATGFVEMPSGGLYRALDIQVPLIVNDVWEESP